MYRQAPLTREIVIGPLPFRLALIVPAILLVGLGIVFGGIGIVAFAIASPRGIMVGILSVVLSLLFFVLARSHVVGATKGRRRAGVRVTEQYLEVRASDGNVTVVPRVGEHVRVAGIATGRGGPPTVCIAYGDSLGETRLVEICSTNGVVELGPAVEVLRAALLEIPRVDLPT
jgi:hypothetical protein